MKALTDKFLAQTPWLDFCLLAVPFLCWIWCFRLFFTGHLPLFEDATSYANHIGFYMDNLSRGIIPLWDPTWYNGAPNDFFLRRIGDVNPLLFLIVLLKWVGGSSATAYLVFLGVYYFLAGWALYLIARFIFVERFFAFTVYVLFIFSSWGSEIFYNYIIIIFVPIIWFFYFLLSFFHRPQKASFLGACLCVGLIVTTYIPFFFTTILAIFTFFYILFYGPNLAAFLKKCLIFLSGNKFFTASCLIFLLLSCIPALVFYKESKSGEFVLPNRNSGADTSSAVAVSIENVASGDIISHGYFDRIFDDQENIDMGDIYVPYLFFLILLTTICARVNKLIFFLLFNILALSVITITSAGGIHRFLYNHIIFFKFIRQVYYFFWLAMLPMGILLAVSAFKSLLTAVDASSRKMTWLVYIIICHLILVLFLIGHKGVLGGAWASIFISLFFFLVYILGKRAIFYPAGFFIILLAALVQSVQVYACMDNKLFKAQMDMFDFDKTHHDQRPRKLELYYTAHWFEILANYLDPAVLDNYRNRPFIVYDNVTPYTDSPGFLKIFETTTALNANIAYVPKLDSLPDDWRSRPDAGQEADVDPLHSGKLSVLYSDANTWVLRSHLPKSAFLVINDNYNSKWHAFINGHPTRLLRANVSFKGIWLPSGESKIVVRFAGLKDYAFHFFLLVVFAGTFLYLLVLLKNERSKVYG